MEKQLAQTTGIARTALRAIRKEKLVEGLDWSQESPHSPVMYSEDGLKKMLAAIGELNGEIPASDAKGGNEAGAKAGNDAALYTAAVQAEKKQGDGTILAVVARWNLMNRQVVECVHPVSGAKLVVSVHDNQKYRTVISQGPDKGKPMRIKCRVDRPGHAVIVGRAPRYVGAW